ALVDGPLLKDVLERLGELAQVLPVIFPAHPRTRARLEHLDVPAGIVLTEPVGYLDFLSLQADAAAVLTDSGGVQEETSFLGVRCFTLRDSTERPVTVRLGTNTMLGLDPQRICDILPALADPRPVAGPLPRWDGRAAHRLADVVEKALAA